MYVCILTHSSSEHVLALEQTSVDHAELTVLLNALHHVHDLAIHRYVLYNQRIAYQTRWRGQDIEVDGAQRVPPLIRHDD